MAASPWSSRTPSARTRSSRSTTLTWSQLVDTVWTDALAAGDIDGSRPLIPDTFKLAAYAGPMALTELPAAAHHRLGAFCFDTATPIVAGTAARRASGGGRGAQHGGAGGGGERLAYGLCRPPGHHAARGMLGGYCFFNNAAIVAEWLRREAGFARVAILDVDYHHGNGTQQIFWERGGCPLRLAPRRPGPRLSVLLGLRVRERAPATARGGPSTSRCRPRPVWTATRRSSAAALEAIGCIRARRDRWCCHWASTPSSATRLATWRCAPRTTASWVDWWRSGGLPIVALQEGGYAIDAIGANARAFLRGLRGEEA